MNFKQIKKNSRVEGIKVLVASLYCETITIGLERYVFHQNVLFDERWLDKSIVCDRFLNGKMLKRPAKLARTDGRASTVLNLPRGGPQLQEDYKENVDTTLHT